MARWIRRRQSVVEIVRSNPARGGLSVRICVLDSWTSLNQCRFLLMLAPLWARRRSLTGRTHPLLSILIRFILHLENGVQSGFNSRRRHFWKLDQLNCHSVRFRCAVNNIAAVVKQFARLAKISFRSRVAQWPACWAHNPKVFGSKPGSATFIGNLHPNCLFR